MGKSDKEFGSQAELIKNEAGMGQDERKKSAGLSRTASVISKASEFEKVSLTEIETDAKNIFLLIENLQFLTNLYET